MRIYDTRIGRFLSTDPLSKSFPWYTPYQFAGNTPIQAIDLDGEEEKHFVLKINEQTGRATLSHTGDVDIIEKKTIYERKAVHGEMGEVVGNYVMPAGTRTAKNERTEYVYHETQNITLGHSGPTLATELTWSFSSMAEMKKAVEGGKLNWFTSNEKGQVYTSLAAYGALEAESEVGAARGLWAGTGSARRFFSKGATKLVSSAMLAKYPTSSTIGAPDGTFVAPTEEINSLLSRGLSRVAIAKKLGIVDPDFLKGDLIRVDISSKALKNLNLRLPTGGEVGANSSFVPGGKTSGGVTEGVVNGIPKKMDGVTTSKVN